MSNPTLILLPGLHGTADLFANLLPHLPQNLPTRILTYPTDRCRSYAHHLRRIEKYLADQSNLILFAESFSGPLALQFAATHPEKVRALILCGTFITNPVPRILCYLATLPILLRIPIPSFAIRTFLAGTHAPISLVQQTRKEIKKVQPLVLAHRVQQAGWLDARAALKKCSVPILCLAATRDRLVGRRSIRHIRKLRPDIAIRDIDAPHLLLQSQPAQVSQSLNDFLEHCPSKCATLPTTPNAGNRLPINNQISS